MAKDLWMFCHLKYYLDITNLKQSDLTQDKASSDCSLVWSNSVISLRVLSIDALVLMDLSDSCSVDN